MVKTQAATVARAHEAATIEKPGSDPADAARTTMVPLVGERPRSQSAENESGPQLQTRRAAVYVVHLRARRRGEGKSTQV